MPALARSREARPMLLVVEDEPLVRELIILELEDAGFDVIAAENGDDALMLFTAHPEVELLFTDIRLPGAMAGWDIAEALRAARPGLPVIYATGYGGDDLRLVPGSQFLKKPYKPAMVLDAMRELGVVAA